MSGSLNKVILVGNLGADPEVRTTQGDNKVANLRLATSEQWRDRDGNRQEKTEWHRVVVWGKLAEICEQYLRKGSKILIEGKITTRKWQDQDGNDRYITEVLVSGPGASMRMLDGRRDGSGYSEAQTDNNNMAPAASGPPPSDDILDDEIPF